MAPVTRISDYIEHIEANFCPYILPSKKKNVFHVSDCHCEAVGVEDVGDFFLRRMIEEVDCLRNERSNFRQASHLVCRNVILHCDLKDSSIGEIFDWIHYSLKKTFARVGIVFGKFYNGHGFRDIREQPIPDPPLPFLSIRTVIEKIDPLRFYSFIPDYASQAAQWHDDLSISATRMFCEKYNLSDADENWYVGVRGTEL